MILKNLYINLETYGKDKGMYKGHLEFTDKTGEIRINITPEQCHKIFEICADALVEQAQKAAKIMTATIIDTNQKQIEEKKDESL
jgi:hypothetical protein